MRALLAVLLMTCVAVGYANPVSHSNETSNTKKTIIVRDNGATTAKAVQKAVVVKEVSPVSTHSTVVVKKKGESRPQTVIVKKTGEPAHQTVIVKKMVEPEHKTVIIKKKVKKQRVCKRYHQNGPYHCEERAVPKKVVVKRVIDENGVETIYEEEVTPRRGHVASFMGAHYQLPTFGWNVQVRLP